MYCKGDKIVHPLYGAGVIEDLEENEVEGVGEMFYVLNIPVSNLKLKISARKAEISGLREVHQKDEVISIIKSSAFVAVNMSDNWNQRYKDNLEKIKSGSLQDVAIVFRNLMKREKNRSLSSAEKKILTTAKQIIISEIALSQNIEKGVAEEILLTTVGE
ncbi:MAG: CarD family transcriptional regulator [Clostridiales bacterium]|jgi:CarD family transcriptional regulator|nr:CarD family transcriptional regulator [Clostridiales bacterium]